MRLFHIFLLLLFLSIPALLSASCCKKKKKQGIEKELSEKTETENAVQIGFKIQGHHKRATIPFNLKNNLIVVDVLFQNKLPLKFIIDTGVTTSILFDSFIADYLKLERGKEIIVRGADGSVAGVASLANRVGLTIEGLGSGKITAKNIQMLVLESAIFDMSQLLGYTVHGILGYDFFSKYVIKIDYEAELIKAVKSAKFKPKKKAASLPLELIAYKPYIKGQISQNKGVMFEGNFMLDTGASHPVLVDATKSSYINPRNDGIGAIIGRGIAGPIFGELERIHKVKFQDLEFNEPICSFPKYDSLVITQIDMKNRIGTIGGEILSRTKLTLDYPNKRVYFDKNKKYNKPFNYDMSGLDIHNYGVENNWFVIDHVVKGSPADLAGIKAGDALISMNGNSFMHLDIVKINSTLREEAGAKVKLRIKRLGTYHKVQFRLKRLL